MRKILFSLFAMVLALSANAQKVTLNLMDDGWKFPTDYTATETAYTNGDYTIKMIPGTDGSGWKLNASTSTLLFGKNGAAIQLPAFDFAVSKIVVKGASSGASGKVTFNVFVGDNAVSTEVTGANGNHEFAIASDNQNAGTVYTIKNTNSNNNQISSIEVYEATPEVITATDKNGKVIAAKYQYSNAPLTIKCAEDASAYTFKVNGVEKTYDATAGLTLAKPKSNINVSDTVCVYNGEDLITTKVYTSVPNVTSVSGIKSLADDVEFVLSTTNSNQVTYVESKGNAYLEDGTRGIYAYNLGLTFTAFKKFNGGYIWAKKSTYKDGVVEMINCDSTATSTYVMGTMDFTQKTKTVADCKKDQNQLDYLKISTAQIVKGADDKYYAVSGADSVVFYDKYKTGLLDSLKAVPCFADVYAIVSTYYGTVQLLPIKLENVSDKIQGTSGTVSYTIDMDGNMEFFPTDGVSGTLGATGISTSNRPWSSAATMIKKITFKPGVSAAATSDYIFYQLTNLESIDFTNFNTSKVTSLKSMFASSTAIKNIDLSALDLSNVTKFEQSFSGCSALETVTFGENSLDKCTSFNNLFYNDKALVKADTHALTGAAVTNITSMFYACTALKTVDLRNLSTLKVTKGTSVFGTSAAAYACAPDELYLSKNFGTYLAYGDTVYITLPAKTYVPAGGPLGLQFTLPADQDTLYSYNAALEEYGHYIPYANEVITFNVKGASDDDVFYAMVDGKFVSSGDSFPVNTPVQLTAMTADDRVVKVTVNGEEVEFDDYFNYTFPITSNTEIDVEFKQLYSLNVSVEDGMVDPNCDVWSVEVNSTKFDTSVEGATVLEGSVVKIGGFCYDQLHTMVVTVNGKELEDEGEYGASLFTFTMTEDADVKVAFKLSYALNVSVEDGMVDPNCDVWSVEVNSTKFDTSVEGSTVLEGSVVKIGGICYDQIHTMVVTVNGKKLEDEGEYGASLFTFTMTEDANVKVAFEDNPATGIENVNATDMKNGKYLLNNRLVIVKNGKKYNAQGIAE